MKTSRTLLPFKVFAYNLKNKFENLLAGIFRLFPKAYTLFRIPVYRIKSIKEWVEKNHKEKRTGEEPASVYTVIFPAMTSRPAAPKCPTNKDVPAAPEKIKLEKHFNYWDKKSGFDSRNGFYHKTIQKFNEVFLVCIPGGRVLGPSGAVITQDGGLMEESLWTWDDWIRKDRSQKSWRLPHPRKITDTCYSVVSNYAEGYPHWLMEVLPRLYGLQTLPSELQQTIIFNKDLNKWQKDSIDFLGFSNYPSISLNDQYLQADNLYVPGYVGIPGTPHPIGCKWVRERILQNFTIESEPVRIYISRRMATKRILVNEDEIFQVLKEYGFIKVLAEQLSFAEQVKLFARAEAVVAPHGAGLGNLLFAPKGCKVLEMLDRDYVNDQYFNLSDILGLDYYYQLCSSLNADMGKPLQQGHDHITVDPKKLEISLKAMFT